MPFFFNGYHGRRHLSMLAPLCAFTRTVHCCTAWLPVRSPFIGIPGPAVDDNLQMSGAQAWWRNLALGI